jgi:hypothetical protein
MDVKSSRLLMHSVRARLDSVAKTEMLVATDKLAVMTCPTVVSATTVSTLPGVYDVFQLDGSMCLCVHSVWAQALPAYVHVRRKELAPFEMLLYDKSQGALMMAPYETVLHLAEKKNRSQSLLSSCRDWLAKSREP